MTAKEKPLASTNSMKKKLVASTPAASTSTSYQPSITVSVSSGRRLRQVTTDQGKAEQQHRRACCL